MNTEKPQRDFDGVESYPAAACIFTAVAIAALLGAAACALLKLLGADGVVLDHRASIYLGAFLVGLGCSIPFFDRLAARRQAPNTDSKPARVVARRDAPFRAGAH